MKASAQGDGSSKETGERGRVLRIRFHGRGGQGAKTAARIAGTAAFVEGYTAQDSPLYGAERRGAPVLAFCRLARGPILERGVMAQPDLIVVADASLLMDPAAGVLEGTTESTVIFINSATPPDVFRRGHPVFARVTTLDLTGRSLARLGKGSALSAPLGAVAARLAGLGRESLREAIKREIHALGVTDSIVEQNLGLGLECFDTVEAIAVPAAPPRRPAAQPLWSPSYDPPARGTARIAAGANAFLRKTGGWRVFRPDLELERCNGCTLCFVYCPEGAISLTDKDRPLIDYDHCKGCGLCIEECPTHALTSVREGEKLAR